MLVKLRAGVRDCLRPTPLRDRFQLCPAVFICGSWLSGLKSPAEMALMVKSCQQVRQNYKINDGNESPSPAVEEPEVRERENAVTVSDGRAQKGSRLRRQEVHSDDSNKPHASRFPRELWDLRDSSKKTRPENSMYKKPKMDIEHLAKARAKTAEEAARAAAVAVAEAEAAALAAETAAREAEAAEAEAEALEAAAEAAAAAATRPPKKCKRRYYARRPSSKLNGIE